MGMNLNYSGTTRFVDSVDVLVDNFGYTGDIAFIMEESEVDGDPVINYTAAESDTTGALEVVADDAENFNAETQVKISTVKPILPTVEVGDFVTKTTTVPKIKSLENTGAYVKFTNNWVQINLG